MQHHYRGCGTCSHCSTGWQQLCVEGVAEVYGVTGNGAHAKYMKCPANTLVNLRDDLSFKSGAAISCGTGTAWGALETSSKGRTYFSYIWNGASWTLSSYVSFKMGANIIT